MERVRNLADYFADAAVLNVLDVRERVWELFLVMDDECGRVALLAIYDIMMTNVLRQGEHDFCDTPDTWAMRKSTDVDKCAFAICEAMDGHEHFDGTEFERIVAREVNAGRMRGDEPDEYLAAAAGELRIQQTACGDKFIGLSTLN